MARKYHSPSSINTYLRCPRKYFLRYIKKLKGKPSIHLIRGRAVHEAIAGFCRLDLVDLDDIEGMKAALLGLFDDSWRRQRSELAQLSLDEKTQQGFYQDSTQMLLGWLERHRQARLAGARLTGMEVKLFSARHGVMGIIDAIKEHQGRVTVLDYKTSASDEITQDIMVQMAVYALLHEDKYGRRPDWVAVDFLRHATEKRFAVTDWLIQYARSVCRDIHQKTRSSDPKDYPCTCGGYCQRDFIFR